MDHEVPFIRRVARDNDVMAALVLIVSADPGSGRITRRFGKKTGVNPENSDTAPVDHPAQIIRGSHGGVRRTHLVFIDNGFQVIKGCTALTAGVTYLGPHIRHPNIPTGGPVDSHGSGGGTAVAQAGVELGFVPVILRAARADRNIAGILSKG